MSIKSLPDGTNVLSLFISPSSKKGEWSDAWKFVARHYENGGYNIKSVGFDQSYSHVSHSDFFIINIYISDIHRLTDSILYKSNYF